MVCALTAAKIECGEEKFHLACDICKTCKLLVKFYGRRKLKGGGERDGKEGWR